MSTLRTVEEIGTEQHIHWLGKSKIVNLPSGEITVLPYGYLPTAIEGAVTDDRADIARVLCEALEEKKLKYTPNFQQTEPYVGGYNQALLDAITLIKTTLSATKTEEV